MPTLTIDGQEVTVEPGTTLLQACEDVGVEIPRFCYHERLSVAGNCRMCLVEMEKAPKPIASCAMPAGDGMVIHTNSETVKKAREGVMEFLLINHPLDCPVCDQGGECDLQDQAMAYGRGTSRFDENKRAVKDKDMGPLIETVMTRCIHCTRCVRFSEEVAGVETLGALYRGENMQISTYLEQAFMSEMSGNLVDLCPVGALTSKPYAFTARSWELKKTESIDVMDAVGSNIRVDSRGNEVMRILPRLNEDVNEEWISDKSRHVVDGLKKRRLDTPWLRNAKGKMVETTWGKAFEAISAKIKGVDGKDMAAIVGDVADMESMFALKSLFGNLGSKRVECRQDGMIVEAKKRAGYVFNSTIAGIDDADFVLLIGANPRGEAAIVNTRLRKAQRANGLEVANIGPELDLTFPVTEYGNNAELLNDVLGGKHALSKALKAAKKPMIIVGAGALTGKNGGAVWSAARELADKYAITSDWNGFNVLHTAASRVGGLDLGLATTRGVEGVYKDSEKGTLKFLFLMGADELDFARLNGTFTVYMGSHGDAGAAHADVILPAATYTEKAGTYINMEGRVQRGEQVVFPVGDAREDWTILRALSDVLDATLAFNNASELRSAMKKAVKHIDSIDEIAVAEWGSFGKDSTVEKGGFNPAIEDFYLTNAMARASSVLNEVSALKRSVDEGGKAHG